MDLFYNSLTNFPESTNDYISNVIHTKLPNTYGFLAVIVVFFFIFSYFTTSNSMASPSFESNSNSMTLELILIVVFIILVVFNLVYLNTESLDINASLSNILDPGQFSLDIDVNKFNYSGNLPIGSSKGSSLDTSMSDTPTMSNTNNSDKSITSDIKKNSDTNSDSDSDGVLKYLKKKQVFHIPQNTFNFIESKALCKAYGGRLATYDELEDAYKNGADWCSYGWSKNQMALFPTQKEKWDELQKIKGHEHDCGRPGVNGGFIKNPNVNFGVNCYGKKPEMLDPDALNKPLYPVTKTDKKIDQLSKQYETNLKNIDLSPFNHENWSRI
jgi:hypothetical protein